MKTNLTNLVIIAVLIVIIILQRECSSPECPPSTVKIDTVRIVDTVWVHIKDEKTYKPKKKKSIPPKKIADTLKLSDTTYQSLAYKYVELSRKLSTQNIYEDSIKVDSLGYITIIDTVQYNELQKRKAIVDFKIPYIKENVYITKRIVEPPTRQLYVGGGISTTTYLNNVTADVGVLFKTKQDHIYGTRVGVTSNGILTFGFQSYWKIRLKK